MSEPLPSFRYHPDPVGTGFIKASSTACAVCRRERGFIYTGPVYAPERHDDEICPWCIADGSAARQFDAHFTDSWNAPDGVPMTVIEDIIRRTPGFITWQDDHWLYHCGDGCAFLGIVGRKELAPYPDAIEMLLHENDQFGWHPQTRQAYVSRLSATGQPTAYLFRCLHCGAHLAFSDSA